MGRTHVHIQSLCEQNTYKYWHCFLLLTVKPKIDYEDRLKEAQTLKAGVTLILTVNITGLPKPKVSWFLGDEEIFQKVNRPHLDINIENLISGLSKFRDEFSGQIWLEVFFVESLNTKSDQIAKIRNAIDRIRPDKVQLNTAVRPTAEPNLKRLDIETLHTIAAQLGPQCEIIADFSTLHHVKYSENKADKATSSTPRAKLPATQTPARPCL